MSGVLLLLLTQGLFSWDFTASPRPSATAVRHESAGGRTASQFPTAGAATHIHAETHTHTHRHKLHTLYS